MDFKITEIILAIAFKNRTSIPLGVVYIIRKTKWGMV